ncbi:MAG: metallophosphoesterase [Planctomycetota bacterium]
MGMFAIILSASITLGFLALMVWYAPSRIASWSGAPRTWPFFAGAVAIAASFMTLTGIVPGSTNAILGSATIAASIAAVFLLLLTLATLAMDGLRRVVPLDNRTALTITIATAALLVAAGVWRGYRFEVVEVDVAMPGLENDVTVMHVADVHLGHQRGAAYLERIVDAINARGPDLVLLNGDLVETNHAVNRDALAALRKIEAPVYFVNGNHELTVDHARALAIIRENGVRVLTNEVVQTHGLQLIGLDYMRADDEAFDPHATGGPTIRDVIPQLELAPGKPTLLMHHSPVGVPYVVERGVDLMVAGHTHAGQVFPMTWLAKLSFRYLRGLYEEQDTRIFVSQGVGTFGVPMRLGSSNEIELIRLRAMPGSAARSHD